MSISLITVSLIILVLLTLVCRSDTSIRNNNYEEEKRFLDRHLKSTAGDFKSEPTLPTKEGIKELERNLFDYQIDRKEIPPIPFSFNKNTGDECAKYYCRKHKITDDFYRVYSPEKYTALRCGLIKEFDYNKPKILSIFYKNYLASKYFELYDSDFDFNELKELVGCIAKEFGKWTN